MRISKLIGNAMLGTCLYGAVMNSFPTNEEKDAVGEIDATNEVERAGCAAALGVKTTLGLTQGEIVAAIRGVDGERADGRVEVKNVESGREGLESAAGETRGLRLRRPDGLGSGGTVLGRSQWGVRGTWNDDYYQAFGAEWRFPYGTNHLAGVVVCSQGGLAASSYDEPFVSLPFPVALVPREGSFTVEQTSSNSYIFAWWNVRPGRTATETLDAQIELFRNGDYCVSTNGVVVERFIRGNPYPDVPIGQDDDYRDWVDEQVGYGETNGLYKFTASFSVDPVEFTLLRVGEDSVVVTNAGEYVFLLEKGREYEFETVPYNPTVEYWMQDDLADCPVFANWWWEDDVATWTEDGGTPEIRRQTRDEKGRCLWMPLFRGSPDVSHIGPDDALEFVALFEDYCHEDGVSYNWYCEDSNVVIESPHSRVTTVRFEEMPNWRSASLSVEATIGAYVLRSALASFSYGTNSVPEPASVSVSFSKPVVFFEGEYEENSGAVVPRNSTSVELVCSASGGERGGLVTFMLDGESNLVVRSGVRLPITKRLAPGENCSFELVVEGARASEQMEDVVVRGVMESDGGVLSDESKMTVVEVETVADCTSIPFPRRKTLGVGESVEFNLYPFEARYFARVSKCIFHNDSLGYTAPWSARSDVVSILISDVEYDVVFSIVEPASLCANRCEVVTKAAPGEAGGLKARFDVYVCPTNVCFNAIQVMEIPSVASDAAGYFQAAEYADLLDHGLHGAGSWHSIGHGNKFTDVASITRVPQPWLGGGSFTWPIENAWRNPSSLSDTNLLSQVSRYDQRFELDADGSVSITKFGFLIQRGTNGVVRVEGGCR